MIDNTAATGFPVLTLEAASPDIGAAGTFPGFAVGVVDGQGNTYTESTPKTFYAPYDGSGFAAGQQITLCGSFLNGSACPNPAVAQSPVTFNISYLMNNWTGPQNSTSDGITITQPSSGQSTYTANFTPSFRTIVLQSTGCGGNTVSSSPAGTNSIGNGFVDAFFNSGTVTFTRHGPAPE